MDATVAIGVAIVGAVAAVVGAVLVYKSTGRSTDHARIKALEDRVDTLEAANQALWKYNRQLIDHIYRGEGPPPPLPPGAMGLSAA